MVECFRVGARSRVYHVTDPGRVVRIMAPVSRKRHVSSAAPEQQAEKRVKIDLNNKVVTILQSKKHANAVFDIFEVLQVKLICQRFILHVHVSRAETYSNESNSVINLKVGVK